MSTFIVTFAQDKTKNGNMLPQQGCIWVFMLATTRDEW
jgi:hypothetical protein